MKKIGLLGGMDYKSTLSYIEYINDAVREKLGELNSADMLCDFVNFQKVRDMQEADDWAGAAKYLAERAKFLEQSGADCIAICTNTMHKIADEVQAAVSIPLINIIDETAKAIKAQGLTKVGLLGTRFTMEENFYKDRMKEFGIEIVVPASADCLKVNSILFDEVCKHQLKPESRQKFSDFSKEMKDNGAQALIFGCTEVNLLMREEDSALPVFDSTLIHSQALVDFALS